MQEGNNSNTNANNAASFGNQSNRYGNDKL